ncbi:helix-turn-helix domain-containing protein [Cellvibrio japonicus]|uniref:Helix-turn-helix motif n=1 Tax=Cellvibrio japonicus (strain Ueda107) TaxID=498211 RepID=B3PC95_CELJU|nr:helix-turn-helix transcriptional regulator [Cellvibrio japonicus]ACE85566.1 Helix-turn-helix motif [Cellvibrio japonicus Ueda107]QEI11806.1 helix-turn-helix transcriptional regulator [Cellvibrio japonicus]QEI15380.1 helix-turn-helix transcriptional regulator [Cellvibrio japonicus]QEI18959.1 helix-turn-helix transcriptional regulator [Cellvibrio japonicus]
MPTALGTKIKQLRDQRGYTLDKLAELSDSSKSYIWELENKAPPRPSADKLSKIADALGVTLGFLIDEDSDQTQENAEDALFYRNYQKMDPASKAMLKAMMEKWLENK